MLNIKTKYFLTYFFSILGALGGTFLGAQLQSGTNNSIVSFIIIIAIAILFSISRGFIKKVLFVILNFIIGVSLAAILNMNTAGSLNKVIILTILVTGLSCLIGALLREIYYTKLRKRIYNLLFVALIVLLLCSFIDLKILEIISIGIFSFCISFEFSCFWDDLSSGEIRLYNDVLEHAMNIYLSIINVGVDIFEFVND